jgi:hypothetical protein
MARTTETISRTLAEGTTQHETTGELSQSAEGPRWTRGSVPFGTDWLGGSYPNKGRIHATLFDAFQKHVWHGGERGGRGPPDDDNPDDEPPDDEHDGADLQDHIPILPVHNIKAMGSLSRIFDRDQTRADAFLTEFLGYLLLNQGILGFESPIRQVALALTLIKGEKVNLWVRNMIAILQWLHPVHHNVPAVWIHFEEEFKMKFIDSTRELRARTQLKKLAFKYPDIDGYIAEFKDLITQANYNLASQEAINLFLKGFSRNWNLLNKVFTPSVPVTYNAIKRQLIAIVKLMQLVN